MQINEVIERHGMQLRDVSREMEMKPSALQSAIDRNLTVKTLRMIANAAKIPIAEFFLDELTDEERKNLLAVLQSELPEAPVVDPETTAEQTATAQADALPFESKDEPVLTADIAFICPHCHEAIKLGFVK